ncbi:MAG TPA: hypothetical protein PLV45_06295, partial [bacterium]|nr:hypothetical protein [bacterium]
MNPDLEKLIRLQHLADEILHHRTRCDSIPREMTQLNSQLEGAVSKVDRITQQIRDSEARIRKNERAISDSREMQGKYRTQLFKLKSNREYQALNKEIELLKTKISECETEIIISMEEIDSAEKKLSDAKAYLKEETQRIEVLKRDLESELKEEQRRLAEAESAYGDVYNELEPVQREDYDRLVRKNGRAVADIHQKCCGNCHVKVRPQIAATA